jgi:hypothetical protein
VRLGWIILALALLGNLALTIQAYWATWPAVPEVAFVWQGDLRVVAAWLDRHPDIDDATVGGLSTTTMDEPTLNLLMRRNNVNVRWCDTGSPISSAGGLVLPGNGGVVLIPAIVPLNAHLETYLTTPVTVSSSDGGAFRYFHVVSVEAGTAASIAVWETAALLGVTLNDRTPRAGAQMDLLSTWSVSAKAPVPTLKIFVHMVDAQDNVVTQHDGLDCPAAFWQPGDRIVQRHRLYLPEDLAPGAYTLRIGLYDTETLAPFTLKNGKSYEDISIVDIRSP